MYPIFYLLQDGCKQIHGHSGKYLRAVENQGANSEPQIVAVYFMAREPLWPQASCNRHMAVSILLGSFFVGVLVFRARRFGV